MMISEIFDTLNKTENCKYVDKNTLNDKKFNGYNTIISVDTEISFDSKLIEIKLYICFGEKLEINLPKIFIDKLSYEPLKYVPHINSDLSICIIDESLNFFYSADELPSIVLDFVSKAKAIIRDSENEEYSKQEFTREFQAYWSISYSKDDKCNQNGLALIDHTIDNEVHAILFTGGIGNYRYLIYNDRNLFSKFSDYLRKREIAYIPIPIFQVNYNKEVPPFEITYEDSKQYLGEDSFPDIKKQFNKFKGNDFLIIFKNIQNEYYGWKYSHFEKINGFRNKSNWEKLTSPIIKEKKVDRIKFSEITPNRLTKRTDGVERNLSLSINVIGLGSVGSNLMQFLSKLNFKQINLVDPDILSIENIYRYNYGLNFIHEYKTKVVQYNLLNKNPFLEVNTFEKSIIDLLNNKPSFFSDNDYSFLITGNTRSELYILEYLQETNTDKPLFIIWVEPYMASGQIMYIEPKDIAKAKDLLLNYPHHILKSVENSDKIYLKEGSCQSGYYPYSESYLVLFLSACFPYIYDIIFRNSKNISHTISWYGDINFLNSLELVLKDNINESFTFKVIKNEF
ncbi:ThiF family adenylyltransferase [Chryseobacterium limigenitum]|nr:ThiF family adenylyltransferase [Chryseobacterium limigenitum]